MQRALIQYRDPKNYALVREALVKAHREDLIGSGAKCLIRSAPPRPVRKKAGDRQAENASRQVKKHAATLVCLKWQRVLLSSIQAHFVSNAVFLAGLERFRQIPVLILVQIWGKRCRIPVSHALL